LAGAAGAAGAPRERARDRTPPARPATGDAYQLSNVFAAGSFKTDVSRKWRANAAAPRGMPVRFGRAPRAALPFLLAVGIAAPLAGCGTGSSASVPAEASSATAAGEEINEETAAEKQEEAAVAAKSREMLSVLEAKKREEAAEAAAKSTEQAAAAKAKKREKKAKKAEQEAKKREAQAVAKAKKQEEELKADADKQREAASKKEAEVKKQEAERAATQTTTMTTTPPAPSGEVPQ
jgi:chemotaxis protein histidine kinase CheA